MSYLERGPEVLPAAVVVLQMPWPEGLEASVEPVGDFTVVLEDGAWTHPVHGWFEAQDPQNPGRFFPAAAVTLADGTQGIAFTYQGRGRYFDA